MHCCYHNFNHYLASHADVSLPDLYHRIAELGLACVGEKEVAAQLLTLRLSVEKPYE